MAEAAGCHVLAIMGSGETSPTMVTVHRALVARLGLDHPRAIVLETPYRFQVNADDLSARTKQEYFANSVGLDVTVLPGLRPSGEDAGLVRDADWVFSGPGSPTFALSQWKDAPLAAALTDRLLAGRGVTVLASAAAVTLGLKALPVYEIYKVGTPPHWLDGLDLMSALGLKVAVIPHYDTPQRSHPTVPPRHHRRRPAPLRRGRARPRRRRDGRRHTRPGHRDPRLGRRHRGGPGHRAGPRRPAHPGHQARPRRRERPRRPARPARPRDRAPDCAAHRPARRRRLPASRRHPRRTGRRWHPARRRHRRHPLGTAAGLTGVPR